MHSTVVPHMTSLPTFGRKLARKKLSKVSLPTVLGGISWERFKEDHRILQSYLGQSASKASLCCSGPLRSANKYCTKVCKTGSNGEYSNSSATVSSRITKLYVNIQVELLYSHTGYDVTCCLRSAFIEVRRNGRKCRLRRLLVEFKWRSLLPGLTLWWASCLNPRGFCQ